ncbi:hypothetical protein [Herbidospora cretacea]|uniref:hypothetical protein n=1 Tax=Herbidospora cretacea TaxID=28444 RepID=UPI0007731210|nr:hypothetical protein [Herbidospora cretacea]
MRTLRGVVDRFRQPQGSHHQGSSRTIRETRLIDRCTGRQQAAELDREHVGWLVIWLAWQRQFCALAQLPVDKPIVITAGKPEELRNALIEAEMALIRAGVLPPPFAFRRDVNLRHTASTEVWPSWR